MSSLETEMAKPESMGYPSILPPCPMVMFRKACAQKSMTHFIWTLWGSMSSLRRPRLASCASS